MTVAQQQVRRDQVDDRGENRRPPAPEKRSEPETFGSVKLSDLLVPRLQGRYRWCKELGWLHFDGTRWRTDAEPDVLRELVATIKAYTLYLVDKSHAGLTTRDLKELGIFSSGSTQNQALKIARGAPGVLTPVASFDPAPLPGAPWLLPCANGWTVELHADGQREARRTRPADLNTHTACAYDPDATAPTVEKAFAEYQPDVEVRAFMLQMWARGLSGMGMERFVVNLGEKGGNGKGSMQGVLEAVGGDYAVELPVEVILKGRGAAREVYRSELAQMRGARMVFCDEPEVGAQYNLGMLKKITGGGTLQGRHMGKEAVTFQPRVLFQMASNVRPSWGADGGMNRRYIEISWDYVVDGDELREAFKEELKTEASGFLNVILTHWVGAVPLKLPAAIQQQTEEGARKSSPAASFVADALRRVDGAIASGAAMYAAYTEWAKQSGIRAPMNVTKFGREMTRLGFEKGRGRSGVTYVNVEIDDGYVRN